MRVRLLPAPAHPSPRKVLSTLAPAAAGEAPFCVAVTDKPAATRRRKESRWETWRTLRRSVSTTTIGAGSFCSSSPSRCTTFPRVWPSGLALVQLGGPSRPHLKMPGLTESNIYNQTHSIISFLNTQEPGYRHRYSELPRGSGSQYALEGGWILHNAEHLVWSIERAGGAHRRRSGCPPRECRGPNPPLQSCFRGWRHGLRCCRRHHSRSAITVSRSFEVDTNDKLEFF